MTIVSDQVKAILLPSSIILGERPRFTVSWLRRNLKVYLNVKILFLGEGRMGWEFNSHDFITFYNDNGIKRQLFALYTPYYNRVCERKNITTLDMVRRFFNKSSLQKTLYPEFVVWSTYVLNWSPSSVLTRTPKEDWSGIKLIVHYFKVFGYIGYTHMTYHKRTKLDDKGEKCICLVLVISLRVINYMTLSQRSCSLVKMLYLQTWILVLEFTKGEAENRIHFLWRR